MDLGWPNAFNPQVLELIIQPTLTALNLTWQDVDATQYRVYCGVSKAGMRPVAHVSGTSYSITGLDASRIYWIQVVAFIGPEAGIGSLVMDSQLLSPLQPPVASVSTNGVLMTLSWTEPVGAAWYDVGVGTEAGEEAPYVTGLDALSLTISNFNNGGSYFFKVTAYDNVGNSATSNEVSIASVDNPECSPAAGTYGESQSVTITTGTAGASIHYTVDGSTPTSSSPVYEGPVDVAQTQTIKAFASKAGLLNSQQEDSAYTIIQAQLSGLSWKLPCLSPVGTGCTCASTASSTSKLDAPEGTSWDVTLRIRGLIEMKNYSGGTNDGEFWQLGGIPASDDDNIYELQISSPAQVYYINRSWGSFPPTITFTVDYEKTVQIDAGATITLFASSGGDNEESANPDSLIVTDNDTSHPIVVSQPYNGQFAQVDAVAVTQL